MNVVISVDDHIVTRARERAEALGKSLDQLLHEYLLSLAGIDEAESRIEEFKQLSGKGHSGGWQFNRDTIHQRS